MPRNAGRYKRCGFYPWARKIPWRRTQQPTPAFLPGRIPWTEEPGGLQSIELHRVGLNCNDLACHRVFVHYRSIIPLSLPYDESNPFSPFQKSNTYIVFSNISVFFISSIMQLDSCVFEYVLFFSEQVSARKPMYLP